jgi:hypothetical protein
MKEPELLEDYAARLAQAEEDQSMSLSGGGQPLRIDQPLAVDTPHPTPRPSLPADSWVQLPQNPEPGEAGSGYGVYGTDLSGRPGTHANAQWGEPRTMQAIGAVTGLLANGPTETPFEVGNISLEGGKSFKPDHNGHVDGLGIDVRPGRQQGTEPGPLDYRSPNYDRDATRRLIGAFQATGQVDKIYFNDPDIGIKGVTPWAGHNDHLHFQLKR